MFLVIAASLFAVSQAQVFGGLGCPTTTTVANFNLTRVRLLFLILLLQFSSFETQTMISRHTNAFAMRFRKLHAVFNQNALTLVTYSLFVLVFVVSWNMV